MIYLKRVHVALNSNNAHACCRSLGIREDQGGLAEVAAGVTASSLSFGYTQLLSVTACINFLYTRSSKVIPIGLLAPSLVVY